VCRRREGGCAWGSSKGRGGGRWDGGRGFGRGGKPGGHTGNLPSMQFQLQGHTQTVSCVDVCVEQNKLFTGSTDGTIRLWNWANEWNCEQVVQAEAPVESLLVFDGCWLFAGTQPAPPRQGVIKVWHMQNGFEQTLEGHQGSIYCLAQGGGHLFSGGDDRGVKTWDFKEDHFEGIANLEGHQGEVQAMKIAWGNLLSADRTGLLCMWDLSSGANLGTINSGHSAPLMCIWFEETFLFTAGLDGHVKVWDSQGQMIHDQMVADRDGAPSGVTDLVVVSEPMSDPNAQPEAVLITACQDKALKMWKMPGFERRGILTPKHGHQDVVRCLAKGPGNSFFSGSMDKQVLVWEFMGANF